MIVQPRAHLAAWRSAPREQRSAHFPIFAAAVSRSIQKALREWVGEWFFSKPPGVLRHRMAAQSLLVYQATAPYQGRGGVFTYDPQQPQLITLALTNAADRLPGILEKLDASEYSWHIREFYFPYRAHEILAFVSLKPGRLTRMFYVETSILNALLKFAHVLHADPLGTARAANTQAQAELHLRRVVTTYLRRFSDEFDPSPRSEELLAIATFALVESKGKRK